MNNYATARKMAERWGVSVRQVQKMCGAGMIPGVARFGNAWAIPDNARKPTRTGRLKPGRKPKGG